MSGWRDRGAKKPKPEPPSPNAPKPTTPEPATSRPRSRWRASDTAKSGTGQHWKESRIRKAPAIRRLKLSGLLLLFLALVGILVVWLMRYPVSVPLIALAPGAYDHPLPALPLVKEDVDRFNDLLGPSHKNVVFQTTESQLRTPDDFLKELQYQFHKIPRAGGPAKDVVMLYIRAHGAVNASGEACLLLPGSKPLDESTWLPVHGIFEVAKQWDPKSKYRKLFLIDAGGLRRYWPAGVLHNAFVARLESLVASASNAKITVMHAADVGQLSHAAAEIQGTPFAYYLAQGIHGAADSNADDNVSLRELHEYVKSRVSSFVHLRRADVQAPVLLPRDADDFAVAHASRAVDEKVLPLSPPNNVNFDKLWRRFAELRAARAYSADPLAWAELEAKLVRLESLLLAGQAYAGQLDEKDVSVLMDDLTRAVAVDAEAAASLAIARRAIQASAWNDAKVQVDQWKNALGTEKPLPIPKLGEPMASGMAWDEARLGGAQDLQRADEILQAAATRRSVDYTEIQYLRLVRKWMDWQGTTPPSIPGAFACQQAAEEAAGPVDPRSHYWIRDVVSRADRVNDDVLDGMLTGSEDARRRVLTALGNNLGPTGTCEQAKQIGELISHAYQVRDEAWATIPHLAAWIDSEAWLDGAGVQSDGQVRSQAFTPTLTKLIAATHELADAVDRLPTNLTSLEQARRQLDQGINAVQIGLESLLAAFDQKCSILLNDETPKDDERTMRQISAVLELPLIPNNDVNTRNALRARLLSHRQRAYSSASGSQAGADASEVRDDTRYIVWLTDQDAPHALSALDNDLLDPDREGITAGARVDAVAKAATGSDRADRIGKLEAELRRRLANVKTSATKLAAANVSGSPSPFECRRGLSKADRLLRAAGPIFARRIWENLEQEQDPIGRLADFDRHALHLWHGTRALENWWGPVNRARPYFAESAEHQLSARAKYAELPPKGRPEIERAADFQNRLREAIVAQAQILESWQPAIKAPSITVTSDEVNHSITTLPIPGLPPGQLSVYLSGDEGLLPVYDADLEVRRRGVDVTQGVTLHHTIKNARKLKLGSLAANALFRGHQRTVDFNVDDPGQAIVVWSELKPEHPRINVRGDSKEKSQIIFVLDCSGSMKTKYPPPNGPTRLEVAIDTLSDTVRLLGSEHYIGLILYGHRNTWSNYNKNGGVNPVLDVELVREVKVNNEENQRELISKLANLTPQGYTPLYRAIKKAEESFEKRPEGSKQVVVISDGFRELPQGQENAGTTLQEVKDAWATFQPSIDIVPIVGNLSDEQQRELRQFTDLKGPSGAGTLHSKVDAENLAETIKKSLRLLNFQVVEARTGRTSPPIPLGGQWEEKNYEDWNLYDLRRVYRIQVGSARKEVDLEGGEHLDVVYNRRSGRLEFEPFLENAERRVAIPRSNELFAVSHYTLKEGDSRIFQVSIQRLDRDFSSRPRQVYAEIAPLGFAANQVFHAFDCDFRMNTPVPMFQFRVRNWQGWEAAKLKVWFTYTDKVAGETQFTVPLDRPTPIPVTQDNVSLLAKPARLESGEIKLVIVETHTAESTDFPLRIRLIPPAKQTEHQRFTAARRVHHVFQFPEQKSARIGVSSKSQLQGSWYETESFEVSLPNR